MLLRLFRIGDFLFLMCNARVAELANALNRTQQIASSCHFEFRFDSLKYTFNFVVIVEGVFHAIAQ